MVSIERTAYPRFSKPPGGKELQRNFTPTDEERAWAERTARAPVQRLGLLLLLKTFQYLHYFPSQEEIPSEVTDHLRQSLGYAKRIVVDYATERTLYRHMAAVRSYLRVKAFYGTDASDIADKLAHESAELLDQRIDIINALIDELVHRQMELPAFSALDTLAERAHAEVQDRIFDTVLSRIPAKRLEGFQALLLTDKLERRQSEYNTLKKSAKRPTRKHLEMLVEHLEWLESISGMDSLFDGIPDTKIRHFAAQAMAYDVSELRECAEAKRYTLIVALLQRMQVRARDQLAEMFLRRVATIHKRAKEELEQIHFSQRSQIEKLIGTLDGVLSILAVELDNAVAGVQIREYLAPAGGIEKVRETCAQVQATNGNNYLPLIWKHFKSHRSILFRLVHLLDIRPTSQDHSLVDALDLIKIYQENFDTSSLLELIDRLTPIAQRFQSHSGLRDEMLRLHRMAHTVISGANLSEQASGDLWEAAAELVDELRQTANTCQDIASALQPLVDLRPN